VKFSYVMLSNYPLSQSQIAVLSSLYL